MSTTTATNQNTTTTPQENTMTDHNTATNTTTGQTYTFEGDIETFATYLADTQYIETWYSDKEIICRDINGNIDTFTITHNNQNTTQEENTMTTQGEFFEAKYAEECGSDSIVATPYIEEMIEDFFEFGYDEIDYRFQYLIRNADAESVRAFVNGLGLDYTVDQFVNEISKDAKYIQDHSRCGEECIVPEAKRIALANADEYSMDFQMMF